MGDKQDRDAAFCSYPQHKVFEVLPGLGVDGGKRLVHEQQHGIASERAGDGYALLQPTGELPGIAVGGAGQPDSLEGSKRSLAAVGTAADRAAQREGYVV